MPEAANLAARVALADVLDGEGLVWHPAVGGAPEGDHHEPGALVLGLDVRAAARLGVRFDQAAVYQWAPDALHLRSCTTARHDILGYWATTGTPLDVSAASLRPPAPRRPPRPS